KQPCALHSKARLHECFGMTPERRLIKPPAGYARLLAGERKDAGVMKVLVARLGKAAEDDATPRGAREDSASRGNLEGAKAARSAESALDSEPKGALPVTREGEPSRSDHAVTACSRRSAERANRKPGLDRAESCQLARPAERVAARGVLQVRLEGVHTWCERRR